MFVLSATTSRIARALTRTALVGVAAVTAIAFCQTTWAQPKPVPVAPALVPSTTSVRDTIQLAAVLSGIISYTRWPHSPNPIQLCVVGHPGLAEHFPAAGPVAPGQRAVAVRVFFKQVADLSGDCDVVYVAPVPPENARILLRQIVGKPVLTVGEGAEFCSDGGMFCLEAGAGAAANPQMPRFSVNLDAIARSGLRVNPQVLRLARVPKVQTPP